MERELCLSPRLEEVTLDANRLRILIVEDEAAHAEAIRRAFEAIGAEAEVRVAGTLREYRERVAASAPDIALVDLNLPDGRAVEILSAPPEAGDFPILIMTSYGNEQIVVEALKSGALDYVVKSAGAFAAMPRVVARALREWGLLQERKRAEERLRLQGAALEAAANAIAIADRTGIIRWTNPAFATLTGYAPEEACGRELFDSSAHEQAIYRNLWDTVLAGRVWQSELLNRRKDGSFYTEEQTIAPVRDASGAISHFVAIKQDITERRRAENEVRCLNAELEQRVLQRTAQLQALNKELEAFAYSVSHDLKAPLRGIDGYSRLLLENQAARLDEDGRAFLTRIRQGVLQMGMLIEDLLAYARMERRVLQSGPVEVGSLVRSVLAERTAEIQARRIDPRLELPSLTVRADPEGLAQVLRNLLDNALKFSRDRSVPVIEIGGRPQENCVVLWVKDNGIGFDMRFHDRIFEIFQRLHRAEDYPGTGIGLAIVRKAVQRMGGRVWAESAPDAGSTFYLELPT